MRLRPHRLFRSVGFAVAVAIAAGCAAKQRHQDEPPPWMSDRDGVRMELLEKMIERKFYDQALGVISEMRKENVKSPKLDLFQGIVLREQGLTSESERLLVMARKRMLGDARPSAALCVLYADTQDYEQAIASCERATNLDKGDASTWNNYGYLLLFTTDRTEDAQHALEQAVALDSTQDRYRNNLGHAQVANGHPDLAIRTFASTNSRANAAYNVAASLERFGPSEAAAVYYERALDYEPNHANARHALDRLKTPANEEKR